MESKQIIYRMKNGSKAPVARATNKTNEGVREAMVSILDALKDGVPVCEVHTPRGARYVPLKHLSFFVLVPFYW